MWQRVAAALLVIGSTLTGLRASDVGSTPAPVAQRDLVAPYCHYSLKLKQFCPVPNLVSGVILRVRINGGRSFDMLLDSGSDLIVLGSKAARSVGISGESAKDLVGVGSRPVSVGMARTVDIGPVSFRNCRVGVVEGQVVEGADGVIPLSLFSKFRLRLDLHKKSLELIPYPGEPAPPVLPTRGDNRDYLLLVATVLNGTHNGYVLLDTGAYCSAVSSKVARTLNGFPMISDVPLATGTGAATGQRVSSVVHFAIAEQDLIPQEVLALDLSKVSRHYGVEVMGVLGFPALSNYVLTIDYRDGWVEIEPPQSLSATEPQAGDKTKPLARLAFR
ncbi:MAG TPA: retropepsin-like aspartic protease [Terriglobia bacterium]|nr:retropepsin-like aspartic protease [Terriglobia bacterium]